MQPNKTKVEDFLSKYPNFKNFLNDFIENENKYVKKETGEEKCKEWAKKGKKIIGYDVVDFKKTTIPGFKYKLECLRSDDSDYKVLKAVLRTK